MIGSICDVPKVLEVMRIVNIVISIIRIAVPIILILSVMIKFVRVITSPDKEEMPKMIKVVTKSVIAAVIVFLIPTFVSVIVGIVAPNSDYKQCLEVKSLEDIRQIYVTQEEKLVTKAEESNDIYDYSTAYSNLVNIKDATKRQEFISRLDSVKEKIDELNKKSSGTYTTGYGSEIEKTDQIKTACGYILNEDTVRVQLRTCTDSHQYKNPDEALPGGSVFRNNNYYAKETIPFKKYRMGLFFGEIPPNYSTDNLLQTFAIMYTNVILRSLVPRQIRRGEANKVLPTLDYVAGSCTQNYKEYIYRERYESGKYKDKIDSVMDATRYFILVNSKGELIDVRYNTSSGILDVMKRAAREGKDILGMVEALKSGHKLSGFYKDAHVYDCRNTIAGSSSNVDPDDADPSNINSNIIYLGDSRTIAYDSIKSYLGFDDNKEFIYAKVSTGYDDYFRSQMSSAQSKINSNKDKTFAVTVNYGVNAKSAYKSFCDYYDSFLKKIDKKNPFIIISVNPIDESSVTYYKDSNTNSNVDKFNNYMKDTCINQLRTNNPGYKIYYCDVNKSLSINEWVSRKYISSRDGIHYTKAGSKYIYDYTKKCVAIYEKSR